MEAKCSMSEAANAIARRNCDFAGSCELIIIDKKFVCRKIEAGNVRGFILAKLTKTDVNDGLRGELWNSIAGRIRTAVQEGLL